MDEYMALLRKELVRKLDDLERRLTVFEQARDHR
jgi:hypothetical protein